MTKWSDGASWVDPYPDQAGRPSSRPTQLQCKTALFVRCLLSRLWAFSILSYIVLL